ncbi:hypothetical protein [Brevundimonas denitrificans]|nr:hypothetical protein [Brevundimonas denitrificans]
MARFDFQSGVMFALALTAAGVLGYGAAIWATPAGPRPRPS